MAQTLTVRLPGEVDGVPGEVRLAPLRGRDEKWFAGRPAETGRERVVTRLLARRSGLRARAVRDLPVGDRDYLVLKLGQISFGSRVELALTCPRTECGTPMDIDFDVDDLPVTRVPRRPDHPLPAGSLRFRLPTGRDLEEVAGVGDPVTALLARCLVDADPETVRDPATRAAVEQEMERVMPGVPQTLDAGCVGCGHEFETAFDPVEWVFGLIRGGRSRLDRDIHMLSLHYHWPLDTILAMSGPRRREYVSLLEHGLGQAVS